MIKPLLCVIAIGAALGLLIPSEDPQSPAPEAAAAPVPVKGKAARPAAGPFETRIERRGGGYFYAKADVNGFPVEFIVDTAATTVALTLDDARRVGLIFDPGEFTVIARTATGHARGKQVELAYVDVEGKRVGQVRAAIVEGLPVSLLGQTYLSRIGGIEMSGDQMTLR